MGEEDVSQALLQEDKTSFTVAKSLLSPHPKIVVSLFITRMLPTVSGLPTATPQQPFFVFRMCSCMERNIQKAFTNVNII